MAQLENHYRDEDRPALGICPDAVFSTLSELPGHAPAPLTLEWLLDQLAHNRTDKS